MCPRWHDVTEIPHELRERLDREAEAYYERVGGVKVITKEEYEQIRDAPSYSLNEGRWKLLPSVTTSEVQKMLEGQVSEPVDPEVLRLIAEEDKAGYAPGEDIQYQ